MKLRPAISIVAIVGVFAVLLTPAVLARRGPEPAIGVSADMRAGSIVCASKAGSEASEFEDGPVRGCEQLSAARPVTVEAVSNGIARVSYNGRSVWTPMRNVDASQR